MKKHVYAIALLGAITCLHAQDSTWSLGVKSNLTVTLNSYSDNWNGEEQGSVTWTASVQARASRQLSKIFLNENALKLAFGQTSLQQVDETDGEKNWSDFEKSNDLIDFESVGKFTLGKWIDPYIGLRIISQFTDLSQPDTLFVNPVEITESFGGARQMFKSKLSQLDLRLAGAARHNINRHVDDIETKGGIEFGALYAYSNTDRGVEFTSDLNYFHALISTTMEDQPDSLSDFEKNKWRHPDITWENDLSVNITKYIMLNITYELVYDIETDTRVQWRNVSSAGLTWNFKSAKAASEE